MKYYISTTLTGVSFSEAEKLVAEHLKKAGFGVITEIDIKGTFKKKMDLDFRPYKILGACNPKIAHKALEIEDKAGVFLPCNIILQELKNGNIEVAAVSPVASMISIENNDLQVLMTEVETKIKMVIENLAI